MAFTYFRVGRELWGQQSIGEVSRKQTEAINSKRKVSIPLHKALSVRPTLIIARPSRDGND